MKISTVSQEALPAVHLSVVPARSGDRRSQPTNHVSGQTRSPLKAIAAEPQATRVEPVINGEALSLRFYQDKNTGSRIIQVIDNETGDIIRQISPENVIHLLRTFEEAKGLLVSGRF